MSEKDIPVMFRWETPWRPNEIEQLQANLGLHSGRTRDINTVMGFVLGQAIKTYRADPGRWISYSRNQNWYRDPGRRQYFPVRPPYRACGRPSTNWPPQALSNTERVLAVISDDNRASAQLPIYIALT